MPRAGWFAVGAAGAALLCGSIASSAVLLASLGLATLAAGMLVARPADRSTAAISLAVAFGAVLVAGRVALGTLAPVPPPAMPTGAGPWQARIVSLGAPREGAQVATLALEASGSPLVAATLPRYPVVEPGWIVEVTGRLRPPPEGEYGDWLRRARVVATLQVSHMVALGAPSDPGMLLEGVRRTSARALALALPEPAAGLAAGILIGLRDEVDRAVAAAFTTAGVSHVVAISGWNIAIVAATFGALLRRLGRRSRSIAILAAIVVYTAFAGASPSVVRAAAMAGIVLLARETGRAGRAAAALGLAVGLLLVADPGLVADAGFQLSVLATAGLLAWATAVRDRLDWLTRGRAPAWLLEALALSLAAQLSTMPVVLATFGRLSLVAPAANLVIAPLVPPTMALGGIALVGGWLTELGAPPAIATLLGLPGWAVLAALIAVVDAAASVPWASVEIGAPWDLAGAGVATLAAIAALPGVAARLSPLARRRHRLAGQRTPAPDRRGATVTAAAMRSGGGAVRGADPRTGPGGHRVGRVVALLLAAAVAAVGIAAINRADGRIHVTVLDVGQGDAVLVEGERGGRLLVDGGPDPDRLLVALDGRLPPWDRRLDLVVLTHPHEDHVAGLPLLLERYRVGHVYESGMPGSSPGYSAWQATLERQGRTSGRLATGDRLVLDSIRLDVLWPDPGTVPDEPSDDGRVVNDTSIVLLGSVGPGRFLLSGDAEDDVDPTLVGRGLERIDVLKVAHHGSRTATSEAFLHAVRPAIAIVSVGGDNTYGHPAAATLERLASIGSRVLRTDRDGTVDAAFDGHGWSVTTERGASASGATLGYHRADGHPRAHVGGSDAALPGPAALAPPPLARRGGDRRLARQLRARTTTRRRPRPGRGRFPAARRGQAAAGLGSGRGPPPRRGVGVLAHERGLAGARALGPRAPGPTAA